MTPPPGDAPDHQQPVPGVVRQEGRPSRRARKRALMETGCTPIEAERRIDAEDAAAARQVTARMVEELPLGLSRPRRCGPREQFGSRRGSTTITETPAVRPANDMAADLALINDLRGPWASGLVAAAGSMSPKARRHIIEALQDVLDHIEHL